MKKYSLDEIERIRANVQSKAFDAGLEFLAQTADAYAQPPVRTPLRKPQRTNIPQKVQASPLFSVSRAEVLLYGFAFFISMAADYFVFRSILHFLGLEHKILWGLEEADIAAMLIVVLAKVVALASQFSLKRYLLSKKILSRTFGTVLLLVAAALGLLVALATGYVNNQNIQRGIAEGMYIQASQRLSALEDQALFADSESPALDAEIEAAKKRVAELQEQADGGSGWASSFLFTLLTAVNLVCGGICSAVFLIYFNVWRAKQKIAQSHAAMDRLVTQHDQTLKRLHAAYTLRPQLLKLFGEEQCLDHFKKQIVHWDTEVPAGLLDTPSKQRGHVLKPEMNLVP